MELSGRLMRRTERRGCGYKASRRLSSRASLTRLHSRLSSDAREEWDTLAQHRAFQESEMYSSFVAGVSRFAGEPQIWHVKLKGGSLHQSPFQTEVTEITTAKLHDDVTDEVVETLLSEAFSTQDSENNNEVRLHSEERHGQSLEDPRTVILVIGWDNYSVSNLTSSSLICSLCPWKAYVELQSYEAIAETDSRLRHSIL